MKIGGLHTAVGRIRSHGHSSYHSHSTHHHTGSHSGGAILWIILAFIAVIAIIALIVRARRNSS